MPRRLLNWLTCFCLLATIVFIQFIVRSFWVSDAWSASDGQTSTCLVIGNAHAVWRRTVELPGHRTMVYSMRYSNNRMIGPVQACGFDPRLNRWEFLGASYAYGS